jgi:hypothetical protein
MNLSRAVQDVTHSQFSTYLSKVPGLIHIPPPSRRYSSRTTCANSAMGSNAIGRFLPGRMRSLLWPENRPDSNA